MKLGVAAVFAAGLLAGVGALGGRSPELLVLAMRRAPAPAPIPVLPAPPAVVIGPGRIEPAGGVIRIGAPIDLGASVVSRLLVPEGERVHAGQVLAILENHDAAAAALQVAERHRDLMRA